MKKFTQILPSMLLKSLAVILSPVLRFVAWGYRVFAFLFSYACIGLSLICLIAIVAELYSYGITGEAFEYFIIAAVGLVVRWLLLLGVPVVQSLKDYVELRAHTPVTAYYSEGQYLY